jgi:hypothetical protein
VVLQQRAGATTTATTTTAAAAAVPPVPVHNNASNATGARSYTMSMLAVTAAAAAANGEAAAAAAAGAAAAGAGAAGADAFASLFTCIGFRNSGAAGGRPISTSSRFVTVVVADPGGLAAAVPGVVEVLVVQRPRIVSHPSLGDTESTQTHHHHPHSNYSVAVAVAPGSQLRVSVNASGTNTARFPMTYRWERCWYADCAARPPAAAAAAGGSVAGGPGAGAGSGAGAGAGAGASLFTRAWDGSLPNQGRELEIAHVLHDNFLEGGSFAGDGGHYRVAVSNAAGSVHSEVVSFTVESGGPTWTIMNENDNRREQVGLVVMAQTSGSDPKIILR